MIYIESGGNKTLELISAVKEAKGKLIWIVFSGGKPTYFYNPIDIKDCMIDLGYCQIISNNPNESTFKCERVFIKNGIFNNYVNHKKSMWRKLKEFFKPTLPTNINQ